MPQQSNISHTLPHSPSVFNVTGTGYQQSAKRNHHTPELIYFMNVSEPFSYDIPNGSTR